MGPSTTEAKSLSDLTLVDPHGWECDLHSIYAAYVGQFQLRNIPWYRRSWGIFFETFQKFLAFGWPVITVTDANTGQPHITTRSAYIDAFAEAIRTRYDERLPKVSTILVVTPFETNRRPMRKICDDVTYKKMYATLPGIRLAAQKVCARSGQPKLIRELWAARDKTFLAIDFKWSERNPSTVLTWGYAAVRCGALYTADVWPPEPENNYRRGHYIVEEYVDKVINIWQHTFPWAQFDDSQVIPRDNLPRAIQAIISSLATPDSLTAPNDLVVVGHGIQEDLCRLQELGIKIPSNVFTIDIAAFERQLFASGQRHGTTIKASRPRAQDTILSLPDLLQSLGIEVPCTLHNAGNGAMMCLLALQMMLEPKGTKIPRCKLPGFQTTHHHARSSSYDLGVSASSQVVDGRSTTTGIVSNRPRSTSEHIERAPHIPVRRVPGPAASVRRRSMPPTESNWHHLGA
ncbi:hypothetical protein FOMPIDRAFT_1115990 [Fomitopsis schrenkii]|uniref:Gfd2/YDR514C-like C-terminal domain-containing protein n=1 Tax=Fomitopsis schrenkii TaxID=2126942 RepID=S8EGH6_FOMSC|nr:hypothetical protein FOMPIDRAFT_1115990 [Fomitopsis schrenkii]